MSEPKSIRPLDPDPLSDLTDGRRQRSERSRVQIIEAMFALIRGGDMSPSAARVAQQANVGLRTVFRHFEDMDSLYGEMSEQLFAEIQPKIEAPYSAPDWRTRLVEMIERRAAIYEDIFPVRVAANLRRFQSRFLMEEYHRSLQLERTTLEQIVPQAIVRDAILFAALEAAVGFQSWRRLRQDQDLDVADARLVMLLTVRRLLDKQ